MAYSSSSSSDSEVSNDSGCSYKSCLDTIEELKSRNEKLIEDVKMLKLDNLGYKVGLKSVDERLDFFKQNELEYVEKVNVLEGRLFVKEHEVMGCRT